MLEELKIEEMKPETKKENEDKGKTVNRNIQVKRAKLVITKFEGIHLEWSQLWNQFKTKIDKANISAISTFFYLKDFLLPKVRALIGGVPFMFKRYARAKSLFY